jgi:hypothetical protein
MKKIIYLFICFSLNVEAYVLSRGISKSFVKWNNNLTVNFHLNTANNDGISEYEVSTIINDSKNEWADQSQLNISVQTTNTEPQAGRNDIFFSSDPYFFTGSGIVGLTLVSFREDTGDIIETDIVLNEIHSFKDRSVLLDKFPSEYFLGNVASHEFGHSLGLSHSEVHRSTMFYKLSNGQLKIDKDDRSGINHHYPISSYTGSISGKTFGSGNMIGIFGVQVQAISASDGNIVAAALSDDNGYFTISGLPKNEQYYLYISPLKVLSSIPSMYADVRKNFCNSNTDFRGSFYSSCFSGDRGLPMGIDLTQANGNVDVGNISIKCGLDVPVAYFLAKGGGTYVLDSVDTQGNAGNAFVGFFSDSEVENNDADNIEIDLRFINIPSNDLYLDIKVIHQNLFSELKLNMDVTFFDNSTVNYPLGVGFDGVIYNSEKNADLDIRGKFLLDSVDFNKNIFKLTINPRVFEDYWTEGDIPIPDSTLNVSNFFQEFSTLKDNHKFYFLIANISQKNLDGTYTVVNTKKYNLTDNKNCPDAPASYVVKASLYKESVRPVEIISGDDPLAIACGTIDLDDDQGSKGNGMMIMTLFGFLCTLLLIRIPSNQL